MVRRLQHKFQAVVAFFNRCWTALEGPPWMCHCKKMQPAWDQLEKEYINSTHVTIADVDCTGAGASVCRQQGVSGYPTIKSSTHWMHDHPFIWYFIGGNPGDYKGPRDLHSLTSFVKDTFAPICKTNSGEHCDDVEKAIIMNNRGKNLASEIFAILENRRVQIEMFQMLEMQFKAEQTKTQKHIDVVKYMKLLQHLGQQGAQAAPTK
eukprot:GEMP01070902.1.p1 GENE.GEMP01070902.1~~GEMP01070902.1.p1  ORF type:complete len:207 (+),score=39.53 GEMP01070902.1:180-800(+)